ncbi:MAG: SAM-dependent methyltransferase [Clostridiales bacterium]|nr:SAM-dependent methyltransferase [Clostridiales bacterium]
MNTFELPKEFLQRMQALLGAEYPAFLASYEEEPKRGLRINTLKTAVDDLLAAGLFSLAPTGILEEGFLLREDVPSIGKHPFHLAGLFYLQEPSAMATAAAAGIRPGMRVLDLCAAPGGKSGAAAAHLSREGFLLANEIVPNRAKILASTLERLGAANTAVTCASPKEIAAIFPDWFDVVIVDAPCSGEGMFRKDEAARREWSPEHVSSCAARQDAILASAAKTVRGGGAVVYSTCTFSSEENEGTVERFLASHSEFTLEHMGRLYPHTSSGEGHFVARLRRGGEAFRPQESFPMKPCSDAAFSAFLKETFIVSPKGKAYLLPDGRVILLRDALPKGLENLRVLSSGVIAGELKKGRFEPAHSLFLAAHGGTYTKTVDYTHDDPLLIRFLAGETVPCSENMRGYCAVTVQNHPVGFGKAVEGILKNHIPKALRVNV